MGPVKRSTAPAPRKDQTATALSHPLITRTRGRKFHLRGDFPDLMGRAVVDQGPSRPTI